VVPTSLHWVRAPLRRFVVADRSMVPALQPGDGLLATPYWPARPGQLRCLPDPRQPDRWLVKRVAAVGDDRRMRVLSENRAVPTADSRTFGPVPISGTYRVLVRVPAGLL
jgi:hypothetical protein